MKTNISTLMALIKEKETKLNQYNMCINSNVYSVSIQELDKTVNIIEDNKAEFSKNLEDIKSLTKEITKLKSVLYEKNNIFKLSDGRTIQAAIIDNTNMRKLQGLYTCLLVYKDCKQRVTEVNNSYFECKSINFDRTQIQKELKELESKIQKTDFEISKLNSIEFEI